MQHIEKRLATLEEDKRALDAKLADPQVHEATSTAQMLDLSQRRSLLAEEIAALEAEWLHLQNELDQADVA